MKDETIKLIQLINENKSISEITSEMNLSKRQLFQRMTMLKQSGYVVDKNYYYNGDIKYSLSNPFTDSNKTNKLTINTPDNIKRIRMVLTSDSHYGNIQENLECTDRMFDYCINENINLIFHLGDFFEGVHPSLINTQKYHSTVEQIEKVLANYPIVDNILTVTLLGNHDASFWLDAGIDIKTILENRRHDIIPVGYEQGMVTINNFNFILEHPIDRVNVNSRKVKYNPNFSKIFLIGHSHRFKLKSKGNTLKVYIPSSSEYKNERDNCFLGTGIPSIIDAEFIINNQKITSGYFRQYILLNNQLIKIGEYETLVKISQEQPPKSKEVIIPKLYTCFTDNTITKEENKEKTRVLKLIDSIIDD